MVGELVLQTLRHVAETLNRGQVSWALVGGAALSVWDHVRNTRDVDFLVESDVRRTDELLNACRNAGLRPKRTPPILTIGPQRLIQFYYTPQETFIDIQVDLLLAENEFQRDALSRKSSVTFPGLNENVFVISCEDLLVLKLIAGRMIDLADAAALLRANRSKLNFTLLRSECERHQLKAELQRVWEEAFPGETLPGSSV